MEWLSKVRVSKKIPHTPKASVVAPLQHFLSTLDTGDSFMIPSESTRTSIFTAAAKVNIIVSFRKTGKGTRCWRIS